MSRTTKLIKNTMYGVAGKIANLLFAFLSRTVFIYYLGETFLGINGLYTEVLSVLSIAELGFGSALLYAMYAPIAREDNVKVIQLLDFYKKAYRIIALIIAGLGISLVPFLQYIVKGAEGITLTQLRLYYCIFLFNTVVNYFVAYKYSYANAQQQNYIVTVFDSVVNIVTVVVQVTVILLTRNFLAYLLAQSGVLLLSRIVAALYLNHRFPILKEKTSEPLPKEERDGIFREVKALSVHQFASAAVHSTDNIIISSMSDMGVVAVGLVSNYNLIISNVISFVTVLLNNSAFGFGNLAAEGNSDNFRKAFREMSFLVFWIYGFCCIAFFVLIPPFITLWIGADKLIDTMSLFLIVLNCFLLGHATLYNSARVAKGHFGKDKWISFIQAIVNLVVSIIAAKKLGLVGVYIGTVVSRLVVTVMRPSATYSFLFGRQVGEYYVQLMLYGLSVAAAGAVTYVLCTMILREITIISFVLAMGAVSVIPNVVFALLFARSDEMRGMIRRVSGLRNRGEK